MTHVTIVGGGITGLATAFYLEKLAKTSKCDISYTLLEASGRFGGKIVSESIDDFIIEGGPDSFITSKPWALELCNEVGLENRLLPLNIRNPSFHILKNSRLVPVPSGFRLGIPVGFSALMRTPLLTPLAKIRVLLDWVIPASRTSEDESVASFVRRRLGQEALEVICGPVLAGIYAANPARLSIKSSFPMLFEAEKQYGSLIRAMIALRKKASSAKADKRPQSNFVSLRHGMNELIDALLAKLNGKLQYDSQVTTLRKSSKGFEVITEKSREAIRSDALVLAVPSYRAAGLLRSINRELSESLSVIRHVSTATISLGFRKSDLHCPSTFSSTGFLVPFSEKSELLGCTWSSNKIDFRAPDECVLIRAFMGGEANEQLVDYSDDQLVSLARDKLRKSIHLNGTPVIHRIYRWPQGNPQYDVGHLDRLSKIEAITKTIPGFFLTGCSYHGVGIPDCIRQGRAIADQVVDFLEGI